MAETNGEYPTVIGPDAMIKGEMSFEKGLRLLGTFDGQIESKGNLLVAEGAKLSGEVKAGSVRLDGNMKGNLEATGKVHLTSSAKLEGDLKTARLEVADGATFIGHVMVGMQNGKAAPPDNKSKTPPVSRPAPGNQPAPAGKR